MKINISAAELHAILQRTFGDAEFILELENNGPTAGQEATNITLQRGAGNAAPLCDIEVLKSSKIK